jgi:hypothetical protein
MKRFNTVFLAISLIVFAACDVALGAKLDLEGPALVLSKPDFMANITGKFEIAGTVEDETGIASLKITIDGINQQWQNNKGQWLSRTDADSAWLPLSEEDGKWERQKQNKFNWSIMVYLKKDQDEGEYVITAKAVDTIGNSDSKSVQERRVVIDRTSPVLNVTLPVLEEGSYADVSLIFDQYQLKDMAYLDRLLAREFKLQWEITDDFSIDSLTLSLTDNEGKTYYKKEIPNDEKPVAQWNDSLVITAGEIIDPVTKLPVTGKLYLQIISEPMDKAGNAKPRSNGWFVYWPDADKPWVTGTPNTSNANDFEYYPYSRIQCQAYDNDGVGKVSYKIYRKGSTDPLVDETQVNTPLAGDKPSVFFSWSFTVPSECDEYKIEVDCWDMYNTKGDTITGWFYVIDVSRPTIVITAPNPDEQLFGDNSGGFTVEGKAGDGVEPKKLSMVWIRPGNSVGYNSANFPGWELINNSSQAPSKDYWEDGDGNRLWEITLPGTGVTDPVTGRMEKDFSQSLNLFDDLSIGTGAGQVLLSSQTFVLRLEGDSGRAVTEVHSVWGDITPPNLSIDGIDVYRGGVLFKHYGMTDTLEALISHDEIYLNGTWGDDSYTQWHRIDKMGDLDVFWNDKAFGVGLNANGTWETVTPITVDSTLATERNGVISASLKDIGGNEKDVSVSVKVDTNSPYIMRISSDTVDGLYTTGKTIDIYLAFNKPVTFSEGTPSLLLNIPPANTKYAGYSSGNGTGTHIFTYTVVAGDNIDRLDVVQIVPNGAVWNSSGGQADTGLPLDRNLANTKNIGIDTNPLTIIRVESLSGSNLPNYSYYNAGVSIDLLLTFSKEIRFTAGGGNTSTLSLNSGGAGKTPVTFGEKSLLYTYTVTPGENTPNSSPGVSTGNLSVTSFTLGSAVIEDWAGNSLSSIAIPSTGNINNTKNIIIDTTAPAAPVISTPANGGTYKSAQYITITGGETGATLYYQLQENNNGVWKEYPYTSPATIGKTGDYSVRARQVDRAGNESPWSSISSFTIEVGESLVKGFNGSSPPNDYGVDAEIEIVLNLREPVTVSGFNATYPRLKLNVAGRYAVFDSASNGTDKLVFKYVVQANDSTPLGGFLEVEELENGSASFSQEPEPASDWIPLSDFTRITVITSIPLIQSLSYNNTSQILSLRFDKAIYKGTGDITITQQNSSYLVPAVLSKDDYIRFGGDANLETYYTLGANGTNSSGTPDLTEKYILKYEKNTGDSDVKGALIAAGADKIVVPVASGAVTIITGTIANDTLRIDLSSAYSYSLRVKGVSYDVSYPQGLVNDSQNNKAGASNTSSVNHTIALTGANTPVIRVQKGSGSINAAVVAVQPENATFKIDCQSPGTLSYTINPLERTSETTFPPTKPTVTMPGNGTATSYTLNTSINILTGAQPTGKSGFLCAIRAHNDNAGAGDSDAYEVAARSVIQFTPPGFTALPAGRTAVQLWIRGGDSSSGDSLAPGFPLSWREDDPNGIRLMTNNGGKWFWISWEVNASAYFHFIEGTTTTQAEALKGPHDWAWLKLKWAYTYEGRLLHPGGSIEFTTTSTVPGEVGDGAVIWPEVGFTGSR